MRPTLTGRHWWRDAAIYQVYVRSFLDGTGDGIGDLAGVRAGLPYLRKRGVDGIWLRLDRQPGVLVFERGGGLECAVNFTTAPVPAPVSGTPLLSSGPCPAGVLPGSTAAWWLSDQ
ncbi:DUF3459 domain-containing protein [Streptomyces sp. NPDC056716]|uniref:alpha-amylase family glycosyl hydrolase n=1 Tax=unclassified Streptomyces TaxID=2593676 RepID=UPI0036821976